MPVYEVDTQFMKLTLALKKLSLKTLKVVDSRAARSAGRVKKSCFKTLNFFCVLQRVYTIMPGHKYSPCLACGRVLDLQIHAKRKIYENMAKASFLKLVIVVIWSVTPRFHFFYLFSSFERA